MIENDNTLNDLKKHLGCWSKCVGDIKECETLWNTVIGSRVGKMICSGFTLYIGPSGMCNATFLLQEGPYKDSATDIVSVSHDDVTVAICLAYLTAFSPTNETRRIKNLMKSIKLQKGETT